MQDNHHEGIASLAALIAKGDNLDSLLNIIPGSFYWKDAQGHYLGCNQQLCKVLGLADARTLIGKTDAELPWAESAVQLSEHDEKVLTSGQQETFTEVLQIPQGQEHIFLVTKSPLRNEDGAVVGLIASLVDVSEQKALEEQLVYQNQSLTKTQDNMHAILEEVLAKMPGHVYWKDVNSVYLGCNDYTAEIAGLKSREVIIGKTDYDLSWSEVADKLVENDKKIILSKQPQVLEEKCILEDGREIIYMSHKKPILNKEGEVEIILGISIEITEKIALENRLKYEKETAEREKNKMGVLLDEVIAEMPGHVFWKDANSVYQGCNDYTAKVAGLKSRQEIVGKTDYDLSWSESAKKLIANDQEIIESKMPHAVQESGVLADGREAVYTSHRKPLFNQEGDVELILGISLEITEQVELEKQLRIAKEEAELANAAKSDFLASVSHDTRTPINGIKGMAQILKMEPLSEKQLEMVDVIEESANILMEFVDDILSFTEIEASKVEVDPKPVNLLGLLEQIMRVVGHQVRAKGLDLIFDYPRDLPHHVVTDPALFRRIVMNLLSNAIKFTPKGFIKVALSQTERLDGMMILNLKIQDSGMGIPDDKLDVIFDRFAKLKPSYKENRYKGSGLGLAIVKSFAELLGGTIDVESEVDKGTTFTCELPLQLQDEATAIESVRQDLPNVPILIVCDDDLVYTTLNNQLSSMQAEFIGSREFSDILTEGVNIDERFAKFKLIIMDRELAYKGPITLAAVMRELPAFKDAVFILHTEPLSMNHMQMVKKAGFMKYLFKPVMPSELFSTIYSAIDDPDGSKLRAQEEISRRKLRILLIEDNDIAQMACKAIWENLGCIVDVVESGREALAMDLSQYQLIFMDIGLPDMNGMTVTKQIRARGAEVDKNIAIIALTAHISNECREECLAAGMDGFLTKPASFDDFREVLYIMGKK